MRGQRHLLIGPSGCGKSRFFAKLVLSARHMFDQFPHRILYFSPHASSIPEEIRNGESTGIEIIHFARLPTIEELSSLTQFTLVTIDDFQTEANDASEISHAFRIGRHFNCVIFLMLQTLFSKGKYSREITLNTSYITLFKMIRGVDAIKIYSRQLSLFNDPDLLYKVYKAHCLKPFQYLLICLDVALKTEHLRIQTNIFNKNCSTIFIPESLAPAAAFPINSDSGAGNNNKKSPIIGEVEICN